MLLDRRRAGVLLHPTSLPSRYGIGDLGPAAFAFLDFLAEAGQTLWQVLPLGPTGFGDSPYASPSAFAGNPLLIAPEPLLDSGLLTDDDVAELLDLPADHVDFARLVGIKRRVLESAFFGRARETYRDAIERFRHTNHGWLEDFALFSALEDEYGTPWTHWEPALRARDRDALSRARDHLAERIEFHVFTQMLFFEQLQALRAAAVARGIGLIGDIPIFVAHQSADVWANQHLFKLDEYGQPLVVAGVPPDYFSATGQLWGNPLYDWDAMAAEEYQWWTSRFRHLLEMVDLVRIDHFRGFEAAWEVPVGAADARHGAWIKGPGNAVFDAITNAIGGSKAPVIAEDLGMITDEVRQLVRATGFPGMKILQFAFGDTSDNPYLPHNYADPNCVVYTGTHDNPTTRGWFESASEHERESVGRYLGGDTANISTAMMRLALASTANTAIVPLQDVLDLGHEARMNTPGASEENWTWRVGTDRLDADHAQCLADMTATYGRSQAAQ